MDQRQLVRVRDDNQWATMRLSGPLLKYNVTFGRPNNRLHEYSIRKPHVRESMSLSPSRLMQLSLG